MDTVTVKCEETDECDLIEVKEEQLPVPAVKCEIEELEVQKEEVEYDNEASLDSSHSECDPLNMKVEEECTELLGTSTIEIDEQRHFGIEDQPSFKCDRCSKNFIHECDLKNTN